MRQFKPLLPIGEKTVIEHTVSLFQSVGLNDLIVVTGYNGAELIASMSHLSVKWAENKNFADGMFTSVQTGLKHLKNCDAFFLTPVDIPLIRPHTIRHLMNNYNPETGVIMPVFQGETGHPPLISSRYIKGILDYKGSNGLNGFLNKYADINLVPTGDEGILMDCDYLEDYQRLVELFTTKTAPTRAECLELLRDVYAVDEHIRRHSEGVAELAVYLAEELNFSPTDINVIEAAGLLHDIARKEDDHAQVAASLVTEMAYPLVAEVISRHMDITVDESKPLSASEIVYLADKLTAETGLAGLKQRFEEKQHKYGADINASAAIKSRLNAALAICRKIEKTAGRTIDELLSGFTRQKSARGRVQ